MNIYSQNQQNEIDCQTTFVMTFTSLCVILLCFFLFLTSHLVTDKEKELEVYKSLKRYFSASEISGNQSSPRKSLASNEDWNAISFDTLAYSPAWLAFEAEATRNNVLVNNLNSSVEISFPERVLFLESGDQLRQSMVLTLTHLAALAKKLELPLSITVFVSTEPKKSPLFSGKWDLALARVNSMQRFFADTGFDSSRVSAHAEIANEISTGELVEAVVTLKEPA